MKNILRLLGVVFLAAALVFALITPLTGCDTGNNTANTDSKVEQPTVPTVSNGDINFGTLSADLSQAEISARIDTAMDYLADQAEGIENTYSNWHDELLTRPENYDRNAKLEFAGAVINNEGGIHGAYQSSDIGAAKSHTQIRTASTVSVINTIRKGDSKSDSLFEHRVRAFQVAQQMSQMRFGNTADLESTLETLYKGIEKLGGTKPQGSNLAALITSLRSAISSSMPENCGPHTGLLIQQWEDMAQFEGWTEDIAALGKQTVRGAQRSMSYDAANNIITMGK